MLFLDIAKVFDTISHYTLFRVAVATGLPPPLVSYLRHLYEQSTVQLAGTTTTYGRGIRQEKSPQLQEKLHLLSEALTQARMALNGSHHHQGWKEKVCGSVTNHL
ncbi:hypothetical protein E2320_003363 [Naja naja]|nr:hypothetical protein E2320_003363 [Naja naja]